MKQQLDAFELHTEARTDEPVPRTDEPVLRFSNPVRDSFSDGAVFLWLAGERPVAAASLWIRASGEFGRDFSSLTGEPLRCVRNGEVVWSPRSGGLIDQPLPDAPQPASSPDLRLVQMRRLARRFSGVVGAWPAEGFQDVRLLSQPLYRYSAETQDAIDGAIFAFAQANDPEILLVLELARSASGDPEWRYSLARLTAVRLRVRLDERQIWSVEGYWSKPRSADDPYVEAVEGRYPDAAASAGTAK